VSSIIITATLTIIIAIIRESGGGALGSAGSMQEEGRLAYLGGSASARPPSLRQPAASRSPMSNSKRPGRQRLTNWLSGAEAKV
jgi:hypothetical protein